MFKITRRNNAEKCFKTKYKLLLQERFVGGKLKLNSCLEDGVLDDIKEDILAWWKK